jgi:hypothetical protein
LVDEGIYELVGDTLYVSGINKTNTSVYGKHIDLNIALDDIHSVKIEKLDGWRTTGCVMGVTTAVAMSIAFAIVFGKGKD